MVQLGSGSRSSVPVARLRARLLATCPGARAGRRLWGLCPCGGFLLRLTVPLVLLVPAGCGDDGPQNVGTAGGGSDSSGATSIEASTTRATGGSESTSSPATSTTSGGLADGSTTSPEPPQCFSTQTVELCARDLELWIDGGAMPAACQDSKTCEDSKMQIAPQAAKGLCAEVCAAALGTECVCSSKLTDFVSCDFLGVISNDAQFECVWETLSCKGPC